MSKLMVQVDLQSDDGAQLTTWVEKRPLLAAGSSVQLKGENTWRRVQKIYDLEIPEDQLNLNRNWDNNNYEKHDGTSMKKRLSK